ncbi:NAD-dependent epimerase/dehydratase family protein [Fusobacterium sp.]|uniref:NAD-dependent epimerase/dehydratase family protein n=1 Tax=Fusobacterium sp. TaxID=68766 RepID=UPI002904C107|nr:NAD-dependent epimerase/dehydratase family protein [Fusobacterium sp.]MDU1911565.1 NAD-dependent epimerase/dehydratase family protein [Fusobacterium sp.]
MKSILLMGGNQFVGKKLCEFLLNNGYKVYVLNRDRRPSPEKAELLKCDRNIEKELTECLENIKVDYIVDVSAYSAEQVSLIQKIMSGRYTQYILISSASIYNEMQNSPARETDSNGANEIWGKYAEDKYLCEKITIENSKELKFIYTIFRPFYIYGPENNLDRESYIFARLENNMPIFVPNKGEEKIQFGYIDDLCEVINLSLGNSYFFNEIFNISGDESISIKDYIKKCGSISDKQPLIYNVDLEKENLKARDWFPFRNKNLIGDISKIEKTGFRNKYSLEEGLRETYLYLKKNNKLGIPTLNDIENSFYKKNKIKKE